MGKIGIAIGIVLVVAAVSEMFLMSTYNGLVSGREAVDKELANIDTQLQRRADLIPNLVASVKGYMEHEQTVVNAVAESRQRLLSAGGLAEKAAANEMLSGALRNLMVTVENYPALKADATFIQLQDELAGTENRIATARRDYNSAVETYNLRIKGFPGVFLARTFGFAPASYFEAGSTAREVPGVRF